MSNFRLMGPFECSAWSTSTEVQWIWLSPWIPCVGIDAVRAVVQVLNAAGAFRATASLQTATVRTDAPNSPSTFGSNQDGNGATVSAGSVDITSHTSGKFWIRFRVAVTNSTGSAWSRGDVSLTLSFPQYGQVVGSAALSLTATSTTNQFITISGWIPATFANKVKMAAIASSLAGNFEWKLCYRTAETLTATPGGWNTGLDASWRGSGDQSLADTTITTGHMWIQFGIQFHVASGTLGTVELEVSVGART